MVPALFLVSYLFFEPDILLYLVVFFVPLSVKMDLPGGFALSFPSEVLVVFLVGYLILHIGKLKIPDKRIFSHPVLYLLLALITWLLITSAISSVPIVSFKRTFIQVLYFLVFYLFFLTRFDQPANILKFYLFYAAGLVIPIINGLIWHSQYNFNPQASYYMPQPFFIEHTIYGAALAFVIPALFYLTFIRNDYSRTRLRKFIFGTLLLLCIAAEFFAFSRAAWVSLLIIPFFLLIVRFKIRMVYIISTILILVFIGLAWNEPILEFLSRNESRSNRGNLTEQVESVSNIQTDISNLERINRWNCAIRMFKEKPWTGFGPGTYQFVYGRYQVKNEMTRISTYHGEKGNAHSEYLGYLSETGIPGLLLYLALITVTLITALKVIYNTRDRMIRNLAVVVTLSLLPFFVHTIFNAFLENDEIGSLFYGSLAMITALDVYFFRKSL
jgi:O-antigen ligase